MLLDAWTFAFDLSSKELALTDICAHQSWLVDHIFIFVPSPASHIFMPADVDVIGE